MQAGPATGGTSAGLRRSCWKRSSPAGFVRQGSCSILDAGSDPRSAILPRMDSARVASTCQRWLFKGRWIVTRSCSSPGPMFALYRSLRAASTFCSTEALFTISTPTTASAIRWRRTGCCGAADGSCSEPAGRVRVHQMESTSARCARSSPAGESSRCGWPRSPATPDRCLHWWSGSSATRAFPGPACAWTSTPGRRAARPGGGVSACPSPRARQAEGPWCGAPGMPATRCRRPRHARRTHG